MGSSASISKNETGPSCLLDEWLVVELSQKNGSQMEIISTCSKSWNYIGKSYGREYFADKFFHNFERTDAQTCALLKPSSRSMEAGNCRHSLFVYVIQFCLSITDLTFETKKKLRSLGRRHVLSGFTREHFNSFTSVLISTLLQLHISMFTAVDLAKAWNTLLLTITEEMFSDNIRLVRRDSSVGWSHKSSVDTMSSSGTSKNKGVLGLHTRYPSVPMIDGQENIIGSCKSISDVVASVDPIKTITIQPQSEENSGGD